MRKLLLACIGLAAFQASAVGLTVQRGDVVLLTEHSFFCLLITPPAPIYSVAVVPRGSAITNFQLNWPATSRLSAIAWSDRFGMVASKEDATGATLAVLQGDGTFAPFGAAPIVMDGHVNGIAPGSNDLFALASILTPNVEAHGELWRITKAGDLRARMPLPTVGTSLDVAADQCTVLYTTAGAIARYDACGASSLPDFLATSAALINVRIAPDGDVLAIDTTHNVLVELAPDGKQVRTYNLPLTGTDDAEKVTAFGFDETAATLWIGTTFPCGSAPGRLMAIDRATGQIRIQPAAASGADNDVNALAAESEWRAASRPVTKRRVVGH